jgi:HSP20 family protein
MIKYPPGSDFLAEPLATLRRIQDEINRAFSEPRSALSAEFPPVNVWRGEEGLVVTAEVPGIGLSELDLTVHQNMLTIKGQREPDPGVPAEKYHRRERESGPFARTIALPYAVDPDQVRASMLNGILTVDLPRPESEKPRKININKM